jgi:glycosyltransferase involved in cell wall biosynthesis
MFRNPKVSCVITTFNRAIYLKQAIDSVLAQDPEIFELIVVDDGSTDDTASIVKVYGSRLHYVFQNNKGASAARNLGLEMAQGEYIAYLDSDDLWEPRKLSIQTRSLDQNPDFPLCYTQEIWYRNGIRVNPRYKHRKYSGHIFTKCLPLCIISPSSAMIRRKTLEEIGGFDENLPAAEDYDLWLRITSTQPVYFIPIPLIIKRGGHPDQLSRKVANLDKYRIHALAKVLSSRMLTPENWQAAWLELSVKCRIYGNGCNKHGRSDEADYYINLPQKILSGSKEGNESRTNINSPFALSHSTIGFEMANLSL